MKYRSLNELNWITDRQNLKRIKVHLTKRVCEWFNDSLPLLPTKGVSEQIRIVTILSVNLFKRFETMNQNPHHFCSTVKIVCDCRLHEGGDRCYLCLTVPWWRWLFPGGLKYSVSEIFGDLLNYYSYWFVDVPEDTLQLTGPIKQFCLCN